ncbi:GlmL-related ornithine degradation protein [Proteiniclasticum sp. QWL-01]|uniref:GlmL-related ornithine degradation protein n=1 Tax=Proteiniclasticum sp. QWL-01 TaxID=3036945 RepID=UPI0021F99ADD|nr:GlmL-related ornithine degradation protein [Proteiniclasticum sp. QWL-01]UUM11325.1 GlmL-related ornithine degradation protein [Clostridiaceae bacterium HFYG-1003]WFF72719.1 GlmL-related ornithine degradation protein [Proteiniclasticum sp. QWL-01]
MKQADLLIAEIGSTTTVVSAFHQLNTDPVLLGQGQFRTTVSEGDVNIGLAGAIRDLEEQLGEALRYDRLMASSSAAGGLRMTVHGLVYDMTVRAAREAALGAGANLKFVTAGRLRRSDLAKIREIGPNIILLAGGVDYGERETALYNAELIRSLNLAVPVIYAGNVENQEEIRLIFEGSPNRLYVVDNVYPRIDELNIEPTRKVIQAVFEEHITHAGGMEHIRDLVDGHIIPTPGAVMEASILLKEELGNLVCADIGGATTDIHSCTADSDEFAGILLEPEPEHKRTVEGDLGMYVNRMTVLDLVTDRELDSRLGLDRAEAVRRSEALPPIPDTAQDLALVSLLAETALVTALRRHAGVLKEYFGPSGRKLAALGKDLTPVKHFIGTGGALTRLPDGEAIIRRALARESRLELLPRPDINIWIDRDYIMASLGVMSLQYPEAARKLARKSLSIPEGTP